MSRANNYQNEDSEAWLGEWMEQRGVRDQIVLATKYTSPYRLYNRSEIQVNFVGNNAKSMKVSVDASLRKLKTDYIDLVSCHNLFICDTRLTGVSSCMCIGGTLALPSKK